MSTPAPAPAARPLRTRIALLNVLEVFKKYNKFRTYQEQATHQAQKIDQEQLQPLRGSLIKMRNDLNTVKTPAERDNLEREMRRLQLDLQEREENARKHLNKVSGEYMVQMYKEIEDAVKLFAVSNDIELVLFFSDPTDPADPNNPAAIQAKLASRGAMPIYHAPNMDITDAVVGMLNQRYAGATGGGAAGPGR
jgi:Skp family chaperone for outer membrane proteins